MKQKQKKTAELQNKQMHEHLLVTHLTRTQLKERKKKVKGNNQKKREVATDFIRDNGKKKGTTRLK